MNHEAEKDTWAFFSFLFWIWVPWVQDFHSSTLWKKNLEAMKIVSQRFRELHVCKANHKLALMSAVPDFKAILYNKGPEFLF